MTARGVRISTGRRVVPTEENEENVLPDTEKGPRVPQAMIHVFYNLAQQGKNRRS